MSYGNTLPSGCASLEKAAANPKPIEYVELINSHLEETSKLAATLENKLSICLVDPYPQETDSDSGDRKAESPLNEKLRSTAEIVQRLNGTLSDILSRINF